MKQKLDFKEEDKEEDLLNKNEKTFKNFDEEYHKSYGFDFKVGFGKEEENNNLNENLKEEKLNKITFEEEEKKEEKREINRIYTL